MRLPIIAATAVTLALTTAPTAGAEPSETILCAFYAEDEPYLDTGIGYAANRAAAEAAECPVRSDPHGGGPAEPEEEPAP